MISALTFPLLFLVLGVLCAWIVIGCKGYWAAKWWLINLVCIFCLILWFSVSSYLGWPSDSDLPSEFRLMSYVSDEPKNLFILASREEQKTMSLQKLFEYQTPDKLRLYKAPYDKEFHKNLEAAMERVNKGAYVIVSKKKILDADALKQFNKVHDLLDGLDKLNNDGQAKSENPYNFYILPPSRLMKKPD